ncbi:MAG: hypothetical protein MH186_04320 [Marinobacter sp.]|nr:hypothetical protein [Marinobacter sp.]
MAETNVEIGGKQYNLLALGFTPTFYAFTEATVEAKLSYTMSEGTAFRRQLWKCLLRAESPFLYGGSDGVRQLRTQSFLSRLRVRHP